MIKKKIRSALISVFDKDKLEPIIQKLKKLNIEIYSTGGTQDFIKNLGYDVLPVEDITSYPSILGGRVKTLHPKVFGGILNRENNDDLEEQNLNVVILLNPKNEEALYLLTLLRIKKSDYDESQQLLEKFENVCNKICDKKVELISKLKSLETN